MDKRKQRDMTLKYSPLRSLDDFLLGSARFQMPNMKDLDKWGTRVAHNLLYYQTNYFLMSFAVFVIIGILHPVKMLVGAATTMVAISVYAFVSADGSNRRIPAPILKLVLLGGICIVASFLDSLLVLLLSIFLPVSLTFVHSSMRMRNLKNKVVNKIEGIGMQYTPMGLFLEQFGMEEEFFG